MNAQQAAQAIIDEKFPACDAAFVGGSVIRGEGTKTSDLDIVVITNTVNAAYRESFHYAGWPVELFVHTPQSYLEFFADDKQRREPVLPRMCAEGIILQNREGIAQRIKAEAQQLLAAGPEPLDTAQLDRLRYSLTAVLEDLEGTQDPGESYFIANSVAVRACELLLGAQQQWIGSGKWVLRALRNFDPNQAEQLTTALEACYQHGDKQALITFADDILKPVGGRLFDGYAVGKPGEMIRSPSCQSDKKRGSS